MGQHVNWSFQTDETVKSMKRFVDDERDDEESFQFGVVDGYGMGLWRVKGWRRKGLHQIPIRGWLSMGSSEALVYFDEDDLVVTMCASKRIMGLELTAPFAKVVKEIGSRMDTGLVVRLDKVATNRGPHAMAKPATWRRKKNLERQR